MGKTRSIFQLVKAEDGTLVFEGTANQISDTFGCDIYYVCESCKKHRKLYNKYYILNTGKRILSQKEKAIIKKQEKKETECDMTYRLLKQYGNCYVKKEPSRLINELKDKGISVSYKKGIYDGYILTEVN